MQSVLAIISGGVGVGSLDAIAAMTLARLNGVPFLRTWQFVASGVLGAKAFDMGRRGVALGLLLHFVIAFGVTTVFVVAAVFFPVLLLSPVLVGGLYGVLVFGVMRVIIGVSAAPKRPMKLNQILGQFVIHIFVIGIPIAWIARYFLHGR
jgi:hypothetical protein